MSRIQPATYSKAQSRNLEFCMSSRCLASGTEARTLLRAMLLRQDGCAPARLTPGIKVYMPAPCKSALKVHERPYITHCRHEKRQSTSFELTPAEVVGSVGHRGLGWGRWEVCNVNLETSLVDL